MDCLQKNATYNLSSLVKTDCPTKSVIFVKLTDTALKCLEACAVSKEDAALKPSIQFGNETGYVNLPVNGKNERFQFNLSSNIADGHKSSFECVEQVQNDNSLSTIGCMQMKMQICAKEESFENAKCKMEAVERGQKKACEKVMENSPAPVADHSKSFSLSSHPSKRITTLSEKLRSQSFVRSLRSGTKLPTVSSSKNSNPEKTYALRRLSSHEIPKTTSINTSNLKRTCTSINFPDRAEFPKKFKSVSIKTKMERNTIFLSEVLPPTQSCEKSFQLESYTNPQKKRHRVSHINRDTAMGIAVKEDSSVNKVFSSASETTLAPSRKKKKSKKKNKNRKNRKSSAVTGYNNVPPPHHREPKCNSKKEERIPRETLVDKANSTQFLLMCNNPVSQPESPLDFCFDVTNYESKYCKANLFSKSNFVPSSAVREGKTSSLVTVLQDIDCGSTSSTTENVSITPRKLPSLFKNFLTASPNDRGNKSTQLVETQSRSTGDIKGEVCNLNIQVPKTSLKNTSFNRHSSLTNGSPNFVKVIAEKKEASGVVRITNNHAVKENGDPKQFSEEKEKYFKETTYISSESTHKPPNDQKEKISVKPTISAQTTSEYQMANNVPSLNLPSRVHGVSKVTRPVKVQLAVAQSRDIETNNNEKEVQHAPPPHLQANVPSPVSLSIQNNNVLGLATYSEEYDQVNDTICTDKDTREDYEKEKSLLTVQSCLNTASQSKAEVSSTTNAGGKKATERFFDTQAIKGGGDGNFRNILEESVLADNIMKLEKVTSYEERKLCKNYFNETHNTYIQLQKGISTYAKYIESLSAAMQLFPKHSGEYQRIKLKLVNIVKSENSGFNEDLKKRDALYHELTRIKQIIKEFDLYVTM